MSLPKNIYPVFKTVLPTTNTPVWLRPYLVKEQKVLQVLSESNDIVEIAKNLLNLIKSCWSSPDPSTVDFSKLTVFDVQWLIIRLREASVGGEIQQTYLCKNAIAPNEVCNNEIRIKFNLSDVKYEQPKQKLYENNTVMLREDLYVCLSYPKINDYMLKSLDKDVEYDAAIKMVANNIEYIVDKNNTYYNGVDFTIEEAEDFLKNLKIEDFEKIISFYSDDNLPSISITIPYTCSRCGNSGDIKLSSLFDFFSF